ncbi:hypothetical protein MTR_1g084080 [Medicago truncatula]|uniref:Uncharacterized protein n=1 Tax=Medicago truncatula TaxID=3880 RepID=A0A072VYF6_MEDTR|nr:hypothetical protein MTR_1g084080 [Medicago truncatula]
MRYGRTKKEDFLKIYDKVASKLASWNGRLLKKFGRVALAKGNMFLEKAKTGSPIWNAILKTLYVLEDGFSYKTEMEIQICGSILGSSNILLLACVFSVKGSVEASSLCEPLETYSDVFG